MAMTLGILVGGVKKGIERISKILMPLLFLLMLLMIARSVTLPGAIEGIRFFLIPDLSRITPGVLVDALGFACFSLSLGIGSMLIYGSYMDKAENMVQSALWVVLLQTLATLLSGFMILPAVFATGLPPGEGAGLTYITLPAVFQAMPGGHFFAAVFFALLLIAALTSSVSILEPLAAYLIDQFRMNRAWACCIMAGGSFIAGIPASWSFGGAEVGAWLGKTPFQLMDYVTSNVMMPVNMLAACLLMGWGAKAAFRRELLSHLRERAGEQGRLPRWVFRMETICRIVAPVAIAAILAAGIFPDRP
jgi:NSS family neurotransmitter:Na+ symporter